MSKLQVLLGGSVAFILLSVLCATCHMPIMQQSAATLSPPSLSVTFAEGKVTLSGSVADQQTRQNLLVAAEETFGKANVNDKLIVSDAVAPASWGPNVGRVLNLLKGVPSGMFGIDGGTATVAGVVRNKETETELLRSIGAALPSLSIVDKVEVEAERVQTSIADFLTGKTIEFRTASAVLMPSGKALLDTVAMLINKSPDVLVNVEGHTDNRGNAQANLLLSRQRATATMNYLVQKGVSAARLSANGYGANRPIANNATAEGQQRNRRIQFAVR